MIGSDIVLLRANHIDEDIKAINHNLIGQGKGIQKEIKDLANTYKTIDKNICIFLYKEFRDRFYSHATSNSNEGIILYTLTLQQIDSKIEKSIYSYSINCGHKDKDNMIEETSYTKSLNNIECPYTINKYYLKNHRKYVLVVFICAFGSMD